MARALDHTALDGAERQKPARMGAEVLDAVQLPLMQKERELFQARAHKLALALGELVELGDFEVGVVGFHETSRVV